MTHHVRNKASALVIKDGAILLVEFLDENGLHYNLPGGGMEPGESLVDTVKREVREEAAAEVEVGPVAFVYEYEPVRNQFMYGPVPSIGVIFACHLIDGSAPRMPDAPDPHQVGVKWVPLSALTSVQLYPEITDDILDYVATGRGYRNYVEEQTVQAQKSRAGDA